MSIYPQESIARLACMAAVELENINEIQPKPKSLDAVKAFISAVTKDMNMNEHFTTSLEKSTMANPVTAYAIRDSISMPSDHNTSIGYDIFIETVKEQITTPLNKIAEAYDRDNDISKFNDVISKIVPVCLNISRKYSLVNDFVLDNDSHPYR